MKNALAAKNAPKFALKAYVFLPVKKIPRGLLFMKGIWIIARGAEFARGNVRQKR